MSGIISQLAKVARMAANDHKRREWSYVARNIWLRSDKAETFRKIQARGRK